MSEVDGEGRLDVYGLTDVGRKRNHNEDQFLIARIRRSFEPLFTSLAGDAAEGLRGTRDAHLLVVADGVGGSAAGEKASGTTVETLAREISAAAGSFDDSDAECEQRFIERLEGAMLAAHERVRTELAMPGSRPASTATVVALFWPRGYHFHVGDSRGYYLRGERLQQFTRDQTVGEFMVDAGLLSEEQAKKGGLHNMLTHAIGGDESTPAIGLLDFRPGDVLMLCSDGLTKHVSDGAIKDVLRRAQSAEAACRELVDTALAGGGTDNVTVVVARML